MGLSRWGERADEKLNAPLPEKTFSETITDLILSSEVEDTIRLLFEGLANRVGSHFHPDSLEIAYDAMCSWYVVKARRTINEAGGVFAKDAVVVVNIRDEDITRNAQSTQRWNDFLDAQSRRMMRELRMQTDDDIPALFASMKIQAEEVTSALQRMVVATDGLNVAYGRVEKVQVDAAIESIKRTITEQQSRGDEPASSERVAQGE